MICHPDLSDISRIKEIWSICFGDDDDIIDFYFDTCFSLEDCYVYKKNNSVRAALQMIPCIVMDGGKEYSAKYMYAACTDPLYQGKGIMSELIKESLDREKNKGTKTVLCVPANGSLFGFYKKFGFTEGLYSSSKKYERQTIEDNAIECEYVLNNNISVLNNVRDSLLKKIRYVSFEDMYLNLCPGYEYCYAYNDNFYAIFSYDNDTVKVSDCFWKSEQGKYELFYCLTKETDSDLFIIEYPDNNGGVLKGVVNYLDERMNKDNIYFGVEME